MSLRKIGAHLFRRGWARFLTDAGLFAWRRGKQQRRMSLITSAAVTQSTCRYFMMRERLPGLVMSLRSLNCGGTGPASVPAPSASTVVGDSTVAVICEF